MCSVWCVWDVRETNKIGMTSVCYVHNHNSDASDNVGYLDPPKRVETCIGISNHFIVCMWFRSSLIKK